MSEEGGRGAFLHGWGHQRCRVTSKATQSLGVDDCNPPFSSLSATSNHQLALFCTCSHTAAPFFFQEKADNIADAAIRMMLLFL